MLQIRKFACNTLSGSMNIKNTFCWINKNPFLAFLVLWPSSPKVNLTPITTIFQKMTSLCNANCIEPIALSFFSLTAGFVACFWARVFWARSHLTRKSPQWVNDVGAQVVSRWWQLKNCLFSPLSLGKWSNLTSIFLKWLEPPNSIVP